MSIAPAPDVGGLLPGVSTPPPVIAPPGPPAHPDLAAVGFLGAIGDFNQKVAEYATSHQGSYGYKPNATHVLAAVIQAGPQGKPEAPPPPSIASARTSIKAAAALPDIYSRLAAAAAAGSASQFMAANKDEVGRLPVNQRQILVGLARAKTDAQVKLPWQIDPTSGLFGTPMSSSDEIAAHKIVERMKAGELTRAEATVEWARQIEQDRKVLAGEGAGVLDRIVGAVARIPEQAAEGLIHAPGGLIQQGAAFVQDVGDAKTGDLSFKRTKKIVKQMGLSVYHDFSDPEGQSGYLTMDILGLTGAVGGIAARGSAGASALRAGEGAGAALKAVAKRPVGENVTVTALRRDDNAGISVTVPLSDNPTRAFVQKIRIARKQDALDRRADGSAGLVASLVPDAIGRYMTPEGWLERKVSVNDRIQQTIDLELGRELKTAAGWTRQATPALNLFPEKIWRGLSVGEQKAIWSAALDDPTPIATQVKFHEDAIAKGIGDAHAHQANLEALKLAAGVFKATGRDDLIGELPEGFVVPTVKVSARFEKSLALAQQASEYQQALKVEHLGLTPEVAEGSIQKLGQVYRAEDLVDDGSGVLKVAKTTPAVFENGPLVEGAKTTVTEPDALLDRAFYIPRELASLKKRVPRLQKNEARAGAYGIPAFKLSRYVPEVGAEFTGDSVRMGGLRLDTTNMIAEAVGRTVRGMTVMQQWKRLYAAGLEKVPRAQLENYTPIRGLDGIPDELRAIYQQDEGLLTQQELLSLGSESKLVELLSPSRADALSLPDVRWVPNHLVGPGARTLQILSPGAQKALQLGISTPQRFAFFFTRPAYALNMLGGVGMNLIQQGVFTPVRIYQALHVKEYFGSANAGTIRSLMNQGKSLSYVDEKFSSKIEKTAAYWWSRLNDETFRTASMIHEMERRGHKTEDQVTELLHSKDPKVIADRNASVIKGRGASVDMDNMTPLEQQLFKHILFVYPWMSRSAVWSLQTILDHPVTTDVLAHVGEANAETDPIFKNAPEWFKRIGYFSLGHTPDGKPKVYNPTSVWSFATMADVVNLVEAFTVGSPSNSLVDTFGPGARFLVQGATGRDQFGQSYKGAQWIAAAKDVLGGIPQVAAYERGGKFKDALPAVDVTDRDTLVKRLNAGLKNTIFTPGWLDGYGGLIGGGLVHRGFDANSAEARHWKEATPAARHAFYNTLVDKALTLQGEALGERVPRLVRQAVKTSSDLGFALQEWQKNDNPQATQVDIDRFTIAFLYDRGLIDAADAEKYTKSVKRLIDEQDHKAFRAVLLNKATGNNLVHWDEEVRRVGLFVKQESLQARIDQLAKDGLAEPMQAPADEQARLVAGRRLVEYTTRAQMLSRQIKSDLTSEAERAKLRLELRTLDDAYDQPVVVNGKTVSPSVLRVAWTDLTPESRAAHIDSTYKTAWADLSMFDKQLVGRKVSPAVAEGWAAWHETVAKYKASQPVGKRTLDKDQREGLAKQIGSVYHGFLKDFSFSEQPLPTRLKELSIVTASKHKDEWTNAKGDGILDMAEKAIQAIKSGDADANVTRESWKEYATKYYDYMRVHNPGFYRELQRYPRILYGVLNG